MKLTEVATPHESIVQINWFLMVHNHRSFAGHRVIVDLACGHHALTSNRTKVRCARCTEMLRRSIVTGEEDYESFRAGKTQDRMVWLDDPLRALNEPTDLAGNFKNEPPLSPRAALREDGDG